MRELFDRVRQDGKKIALASSGKDNEVRYYEKIAGIEGLSDSLVTADQVPHSKPKPDVFVAALRTRTLPTRVQAPAAARLTRHPGGAPERQRADWDRQRVVVQ